MPIRVSSTGRISPVHAIRAVRDREGTILYQWPDDKERCLVSCYSYQNAWLDADVVLNGTGRGIRYTTAYTGAKTGTTDHYKDLWVGGMNDNYTTAVWVGYDRPQSIKL